MSLLAIVKRKYLFAIVIGLWISSFLSACVEPYSLPTIPGTKILTIDATITDTSEQQTIKITESVTLSSYSYSIPIKNAKVELLVNGTEKIQLTETTSGTYALPKSFLTKTGSTYQLLFEKSDGTKYESGKETMVSVPEITSVYDQFLEKDRTSGDIPTHNIYLDTKDPVAEKNNYLWSWILWERQDICRSCENSRFFTTPAPLGSCIYEEEYKDVPFFDYICDKTCWEVIHSTSLNVFSDIYSNGLTITGRLVAKIPYYSEKGCLVEIKQQSISAPAYRYLKLLADQVQNNGGLVDTPPAAIIGNVKNINKPDEIIAGFFMVTGVRTVKYWLTRENAKDKNARPLTLLNHTINFEPTSEPPEPPRPPMAPCLVSKTRTPNKPNGWVE